MLGSFPPQCQGVQDYCGQLVQALGEQCRVAAIGFKCMYPRALFPGVKQPMDDSKPPLRATHLTVKHPLTWYNPFGWLYHALTTPCDLFHLQWWSLPLFPVALAFVLLMKLRGKAIVITVHNVLPHEGSPNFLRAGRFLCHRADAVIVHSDANAKQIVDAYQLPLDKVHKIAMGVQAQDITRKPQQDAREALSLPDGAHIALLFGIIRPYKGIEVALESLALITNENPHLHLLIAGKPWESWEPYQAIIDRENLADRVHLFLDYIPEEQTSDFFAAADLILLPYTHFDAQSAVGAQVLPYQTPLIVSDVGGLPEWVDHQQDWIVPPNGPEQLARALKIFFDDLPANTNAFASIADTVLSRNTWPNAATLHTEIYERIRAAKGIR
jgi:glycosyltransferase involved in cell wall biosynthesis